MNLRRADGLPLVIGHRGAAAVAPENTLEALAAGVAAGSDAIEFDVGGGLLLGHSPAERPARPVYLDDALAFLRGEAVGVHIDLKEAGIEPEVARAVARYDLAERTLVSSTSPRALRLLAAAAPTLTRAVSYPRDRYGLGTVRWPHRMTDAFAAAARAAMPARVPGLLGGGRASVLSLHHTLVSPAVVRTARARGGHVITWTVNAPAEIERVVAAGVDGVVTDDPARALEVLATLKRP